MKNIQKIFASVCRIRILKALASGGETNIMNLVRRTNSTWTEVDRNIKLLEKEGIVESRFLQNQRLIRLRENSDKVEAVLKALRILEMATLTQSTM